MALAAAPAASLARDDVSGCSDQLGRYIVQDGEAGVAVYRVAHQSLADHLRPPTGAPARSAVRPAGAPVLEALAARYRGAAGRRRRRHGADAICGATPGGTPPPPAPPGWTVLRSSPRTERELLPDVAMAALAGRRRLRHWGHRAGRGRPHRGSRPALPGAGRATTPPSSPTSPRAEQPRHPLQRGGPPPGRAGARRGSRPALPAAGRATTPPTCPTSPAR